MVQVRCGLGWVGGGGDSDNQIIATGLRGSIVAIGGGPTCPIDTPWYQA